MTSLEDVAIVSIIFEEKFKDMKFLEHACEEKRRLVCAQGAEPNVHVP